LTSGDASCSAPAADRLARSFLARRFMWRKPSRGTSSVEGRSHRRQHTMQTEEQSTQHVDECDLSNLSMHQKQLKGIFMCST
jgi:hypothetical protein